MGLGQQIREKKLAALRSVRADFINIAKDDPWLPGEPVAGRMGIFEARNELNKFISII